MIVSTTLAVIVAVMVLYIIAIIHGDPRADLEEVPNEPEIDMIGDDSLLEPTLRVTLVRARLLNFKNNIFGVTVPKVDLIFPYFSWLFVRCLAYYLYYLCFSCTDWH